jgi:hypothetical protein
VGSQAVFEQLRRIISEFSEYILYIITPVTRYISMPCCDIPEHVTNFQDPDFLSQILADLTKLKFSLRKKLSPAIILDGIELVCGAARKGSSRLSGPGGRPIRFIRTPTFMPRWR